jgi:putative DNA methylase
MSNPIYRKKLIEVALPLEAINRESAREKSIRHGHPSTLHLWWARRPLAACRAVLFAQLVEDPSSNPDKFPTEEDQKNERERLFKIIEELVKWENINNDQVLEAARREILKSTVSNLPAPRPGSFYLYALECEGGSHYIGHTEDLARRWLEHIEGKGSQWTKTHKPIKIAHFEELPSRDEAVKREKDLKTGFGRKWLKDLIASGRARQAGPPPVLDPFCGGGSIPLEAQRLGLEAHASDLNPVAVLITKALIEIPPKFAGQAPVCPRGQTSSNWQGAKGLAEDVRYYGRWMRDEAEKRIGQLYPKVRLPKENGGSEAKVIAWLWARTVKCPNPACGAQMPLVRSFALSTKKGKRAWVEPVVDRSSNPPAIDFIVKPGEGKPRDGTVNRRGATCLCCDAPVTFQHVRSEGRAGKMSERLMAIVAEGHRGRVYLSPTAEHEKIAKQAEPENAPETDLPPQALGFRIQQYGMSKHRDLFTPRQLVALTTFSDLVKEAREQVRKDALKAGMPDDGKALSDGGRGADAYADALSIYLAFGVDRLANRSSTICIWNTGGEKIEQTFTRQALPMTWDFAEANVLGGATGSWEGSLAWIPKILQSLPGETQGFVKQLDATATVDEINNTVILTDPPYYDNIGYADLSDFFYIWLRRSLKSILRLLFSTLLVPKSQEIVAVPYRFGGDANKAQLFFEKGLNKAFGNLKDASSENNPIALFYAFKQAEKVQDSVVADNGRTIVSTGWETMLDGLLNAGLGITGTWPMRTERDQGVKSGSNVLASSIVIACRARGSDQSMTTRRDFINLLKQELPPALKTLQEGNIAPVDLAQSAIGPGMAVFSRYSKVLEADGTPMRVRSALGLINQVLDEFLAEQEAEFDGDTRWALAWFEQYGVQEGPYGVAETLSKAKNTAVQSMVQAGIIASKAGKVRILRRDELADDWDPAKDKRLTVWEVTQQLIRRLMDKGSEEAAANLLRKVGGIGEVARDLAYRLYTICERKKWAQEALGYNSLVVAWPELVKLAGRQTGPAPTEQDLFDRG